MKPDDLIGVRWLTIQYCEKVTLPVKNLMDMKGVTLENINDIEFIHSEESAIYAKHFTHTNFIIKNSTLQKFFYQTSKLSRIDALTFDGVKVTDEIEVSNVEIDNLTISNCRINKIRQEALDVKVTNVLKIQNNTFKEVESNAFKKLRY